jgi:hypothetical protein
MQKLLLSCTHELRQIELSLVVFDEGKIKAYISLRNNDLQFFSTRIGYVREDGEIH